jgi:CRISPR-associated endonuclease Csy4
MWYYVDIRIRPDMEFPAHQLMSALYANLHRVLVQTGLTTVGVAFPGYRLSPPDLGATLRLLGPASDLDRLMARGWLLGMRDHVAVTPISEVPAKTAHRRLCRVQAKSSPERLRRRQMRRHGFTEDEARSAVPDSAAERLKLPFVSVASASTGQHFRIFLHLGEAESQAQTPQFNAYGLSSTSTIPWF